MKVLTNIMGVVKDLGVFYSSKYGICIKIFTPIGVTITLTIQHNVLHILKTKMCKILHHWETIIFSLQTIARCLKWLCDLRIWNYHSLVVTHNNLMETFFGTCSRDVGRGVCFGDFPESSRKSCIHKHLEKMFGVSKYVKLVDLKTLKKSSLINWSTMGAQLNISFFHAIMVITLNPIKLYSTFDMV